MSHGATELQKSDSRCRAGSKNTYDSMQSDAGENGERVQ